MANTKIVVLQRKKIIMAGIALFIVILLVLFVLQFIPSSGSGDSVTDSSDGTYEAGIYTKEIEIGDAVVNLQMTLDEEQIKGIELVNLEETVETMYPLMESTVEEMSVQLSSGTALEDIEVSDSSKYTEEILAEAVSSMLKEHTK